MPIAHNPDTGETMFLDNDNQWKKAQQAFNPKTREIMAFDGKDWVHVDNALAKSVAGDISRSSSQPEAPTTKASDVAANLPDEFGLMAQRAPGAVDTAATAISNIPSSAGRLAKDIGQTVIHPVETATNIAKIGQGVMQKLGIMSGEDAKPYADAVGRFLAERYGSGEAIRKTLENDPVGMAADIATVLGGGELALARAPGAIGTAGRVAGTIGRAVDPLSVAGKAVTGAAKPLAAPFGLTTGVGSESIRLAAEAGAKGGEAAEAFRRPEGIVEDAKRAVTQMRIERGDIYRKEMAAIGANKTVLPFDKINDAVFKVASVKTFKARNISPKTGDIRAELLNVVDEWRQLDAKEYHTPEGLDAMKQEIGEIRNATQYGTPARKVADDVYNAVKGTIVREAPEYAKVMKGYEEASDLIREMETTLSLDPKASVDTQLRKLLSALRDNVNTNYGRRKELVGFLARAGAKNLLYKIAGKTLESAVPRGLSRVPAIGEAGGALAALAAGNPAVAAAFVGGAAASSPALVGGAAHLAGAATRLPVRKSAQAARLFGSSNQ